MTFSFKLISLITLTTLSACYLPQAQSGADDITSIRNVVDAKIRPLMAEYDVPGMAIAVTIDGEHHFFNYGVASRESNTPVTEETLFEVGSVSKTFTATLTTYAQALGKLSLSDNPGQHMPPLTGSAIEATYLGHFEIGEMVQGLGWEQYPYPISLSLTLNK